MSGDFRLSAARHMSIFEGAAPIGPGLGQLGLASTLSHPQLTLYSDSAVVGSATGGWDSDSHTAPYIVEATNAVGTFPLLPGSTDCALAITLAPGNYTLVLGSSDGAAGTGLVEVYQVPAQ